MKKIFLLPSLLFLLFLFSCAASTRRSDTVILNVSGAGAVLNEDGKEIRMVPAPTAFQNVARIMKSPGYWISKIQNPDAVILTAKEIEAVNAKTLGKSLFLNDIRYFAKKYYKPQAYSMHIDMLNSVAKYYNGHEPRPVGKNYFSTLEKNIDFDLFKSSVNVRFAMTTGYAELRALPTDEAMFSSLDTLDIDRMQITQLDLASPLAILYETKDGQWLYAVSEIAEGWIRKGSLAYCKQEAIRDYKRWDKFAVAVSPKTDIYLNKEMTSFFDSVLMGTALPIAAVSDGVAEVRIPVSKGKSELGFRKAFISMSDVSIGYLKYTQRNVLQQAFKHLNSPYGWGGMNGEQDCSSFIRQIFACFGIVMPRNSTGQIQNGTYAASFEKGELDQVRASKIIRNGIPAISVIYFPGHIMLYVGHEAGKPYIIHSIWGYGEETDEASKTFLINRVAISTMEIGEASKKGSLLQRIELVKNIK